MACAKKTCGGEDTDGKKYKDVCEMWSSELSGEGGRDSWYAQATRYWEAREASVEGVLGGYPETSGPDLRESRRFLELMKRAPGAPGFGCALDCGAGIGRVTSGLLLDFFSRVDLVEPNKRLLDAACSRLSGGRVERFICSGLQEFEPEQARYDVIWAQWVLLYLPDDDLTHFLQRCRGALKRQGLVCVKENVVLEGEWLVDKEDNSISRTESQYKAIFERAGYSVLHELKQTCWPPDLIPVKMYALRPIGCMKRPASTLSE